MKPEVVHSIYDLLRGVIESPRIYGDTRLAREESRKLYAFVKATTPITGIAGREELHNGPDPLLPMIDVPIRHIADTVNIGESADVPVHPSLIVGHRIVAAYQLKAENRIILIAPGVIDHNQADPIYQHTLLFISKRFQQEGLPGPDMDVFALATGEKISSNIMPAALNDALREPGFVEEI